MIGRKKHRLISKFAIVLSTFFYFPIVHAKKVEKIPFIVGLKTEDGFEVQQFSYPVLLNTSNVSSPVGSKDGSQKGKRDQPPNRNRYSGSVLPSIKDVSVGEMSTFIQNLKDSLCESVKPGKISVSIGISAEGKPLGVGVGASGGLTVEFDCR